jgi:hypothetical protein
VELTIDMHVDRDKKGFAEQIQKIQVWVKQK